MRHAAHRIDHKILDISRLVTQNETRYAHLVCDEGRVYDDHVEGTLMVGRHLLGAVKVIEHEARVLRPLLIVLFIVV